MARGSRFGSGSWLALTLVLELGLGLPVLNGHGQGHGHGSLARVSGSYILSRTSIPRSSRPFSSCLPASAAKPRRVSRVSPSLFSTGHCV